jgi:starch phosphorylase
MMTNLQLYNVGPRIPQELAFLEELSYNIWWCWQQDAIDLFVRIDPKLWNDVNGNVGQYLGKVPQARLEELAQDQSYLKHIKRIKEKFRHQVNPGDITKRETAYFSMEYGIHESVRIYSGGLGVLSGDHLKAASDLNLPIIGIGLLYRQGYFKQVLDRNGRQLERYPENELNYMPLTRACDPDGKEIFVEVKLIDRMLTAAVWILQVGNTPLVLLDTELPQNPPDLRQVAWRLYGGDRKNRLEQELLLGVGGIQALLKLGCNPAVCHMNEGHAGFLSLARMIHLEQQGMDIDTALEVVWRSNIFTTHTPVPAGNETFEIELVRPYLQALLADSNLDVNRVIDWAIPIHSRGQESAISMTVLGLRMANYSNGVSKLHGEVARQMWQHIWPGRAVDEIPIKHITNGIHIDSWLAPRKRSLFKRYLNLGAESYTNFELVEKKINSIPDDELWLTHELCRHNLIRRIRRLSQQYMSGISRYEHQIQSAQNMFDHEALTIGFARRFATYKRAALLLRDPERLKALLNNEKHPVQLVFAGKAHPADEAGKDLIQRLITFSRQPEVRNRIIFLENYNINLARTMVQGVDVWLNTPRRPQEASGTSGMKAAANGVLNCSILDGWWDEAYNTERGWAIVGDEMYDDSEDCDEIESHALFNLLEREIVPCFYERSDGDLPTRWLKMMKASIAMALGEFSSNRMVQEYDKMFYRPALENYNRLMADQAAAALALVEQKKRYVAHFPQLSLTAPVVEKQLNDIHVGDEFTFTAEVYLGELRPEDVSVQLYYGKVNVHNEIIESSSADMTMLTDHGDNNYTYQYNLTCEHSGRFGLTARIVPVGSDWEKSVPGFMTWPNS